MTKSELRKIAKENAVSRYLDYRDWLSAIFTCAKELDPTYSYAKFSSDLGLGSSNAHSVMAGKRKLTRKTAAHIVAAFAMKGSSRKFFNALVDYECSTNVADRDEAFGALVRLKTEDLLTELDCKQLLL